MTSNSDPSPSTEAPLFEGIAPRALTAADLGLLYGIVAVALIVALLWHDLRGFGTTECVIGGLLLVAPVIRYIQVRRSPEERRTRLAVYEDRIVITECNRRGDPIEFAVDLDGVQDARIEKPGRIRFGCRPKTRLRTFSFDVGRLQAEDVLDHIRECGGG